MTPLAAVRERLAAARLFHVVESVAADLDTTADTLLTVTGRVSPAQAALFRALAAEGQDAAAIAKLLGWGEAAVERVLEMPEPEPTPVPSSGERPKAVDDPAKAVLRRQLSKLRVTLRASEARATDLEKRFTLLERRLRRVESRLTDDAGTDIGPVPQHLVDEIRIAADDHGLSVADIVGRARTKEVSQARAEAAWRLRHLHDCTLPAIGRALGRRDHTTIMSLLHGFQPSRALRALLTRKAAA